jgi:hypothetical protein
MSNSRMIKWGGLLAVAAVTCGLGHHFGGNAHIRRKLGQAPLAQASCLNCHFVSAQRLEWAKPRPHHDSPAGLAITPDEKRLLIALEDRDEIAEASIDSARANATTLYVFLS